MKARAFGPLVCAVLVASVAQAYRPPLPQGWVTDAAGKLTPQDRAYLDDRLKRFEQETGAQVFVFIPASLNGEPIEDVAYNTFQTWKVGQKGKDNGVLLVWAPAERRVFIATGKGVGGELTDVQAFRIIQRMKPYLQANQARQALQTGTDGIMEAISGHAPPDAMPRRAGGKTDPEVAPVGSSDVMSLLCPLLVLLFVVFIISRRRRGGILPFPIFWGGGRGWGGGGGGGGWGGGGGGDGGGGGGFSGGGGGESGGGGGGDSY